MHILMPSASAAGAVTAKRGLERAGHVVLTCEADETGRCVAVRGGRCPLETAPVDMVLLVRAAASPDRLPGEEGVFCGARRRTPVVVAGAAPGHPYGDIATVDDETDDVLTTVETVRALPLIDHTVAANVAFHACLARHGLEPAHGYARVYRRNGGLAVQLHFQGERPDHSIVMAATVRVLQAVRELDPWASGVDVSVA